jgi:hypothetical protein
MGKAGRKNKYETHVKPYFEKIKKWYLTKTETQIAQKLGITVQSWIKYKNQYPELRELLQDSKEDLVDELKGILKKKAQGFYYTETTKTVIKEDGKETKKIEERQRYAQPDTGAIHLLLKNLDDDWHNDDKQTMDIKRKQVELTEQKINNDEW